jgi:ribosomal protein S27E
VSPIASTRETSTCPKCGNPVQPPAPPATEVTCPSCGTVLKLDKKGKLVAA